MRAIVIAAIGWAFLASQARPHDKTYWSAIAEAKFELPAGATAPPLADELVACLGSPDPELRDDLAVAILTSWVYRKKLLTDDELRPIVAVLEGNLRKGVGEVQGDGILLRSFSALVLSVIAARENEAPFLTAPEFDRLVDNALAYFRDERDTRGFDAAKGWLHGAAHTADLLKFLARNPRLAPAGQARMLSALLAKNAAAGAPFSQGEDERMARVAISIARRPDFDRAGFRTWLAAAQAIAKFPARPTADNLRAGQNVRHVLTALWTELSVDERPSDGADFAKQAVRETLKTLF